MIAQATLAGPEVLAGDRLASSNAGVGAAPPFRVLTFNVWNDSRDSAATIDRIVASGADVVTLQEALGFERLSSVALTAAYPYRATCDDWWGCEILILSKRPILDHHYAAPKPEGSGRAAVGGVDHDDSHGRAARARSLDALRLAGSSRVSAKTRSSGSARSSAPSKGGRSS